MKSNFIHLHNHSHYSLLDGLTKINNLVAKAKQYNMPAVALTDHGVMYGAIEFYNECINQGIKPIIGCEIYIAPRTMYDKTPKIDTRPYHLVLLAKNKTGYKNLIKLVSLAHLKGYYYKPRIDKNILSQYADGLIATGACLHGEISRLVLSGKYAKAKDAIGFYKKIFGHDNFYLEVQYRPELPGQVKANEAMYKLAQETDTKVIAANDSHYLDIEDREVHEVLLSVQTGKDFDDKSRLSMINSDLSFYSPEHAQKIFADHPEVLKNTLEIADKCNLKINLGDIILPHFDIPKGETSISYLEKLSRQGMKKRYPNVTNEQKKRFEYELSVIKKTGYADYFLIVADFINWAKDQGIIVGPGRGSAAGSMIAYCLRITDLEPMRYGLLFERFLNPERISMPDIDVDFADDRRGEVIKYVQQKYGVDNVSQIITFGTMAARGSIRDTARALGMSYDDGDRVSKMIPTGSNLKEALEEVSDLKKVVSQEENIKKLYNMAQKLEGVARHAGTHACGVVISKDALTEYLPLQMAAKGETSVTTQYSMKYVEEIGLLKMDFLGLSNLTVIKNCLRIIKKLYKREIDISKLPINDKKTYNLLSQGRTTGVFQLESSGMKRYLKQLKPSVFEDIIAMVALYRPGPMENIPDYIAGKHGTKQITYLHPKLEPILKKTYGIAVYQEQLMQIARTLGGFTYGEADVLRKAVGKKIKELLDQQKQKLIDGMVRNKIPRKTAEKIWQFIEPFAAYGFNKSHAACYAMIAYWTAYLKAHYPSCFMAALLTSDFGNLDRVAIEISECEEMGIKVLPPSVNESFVEFGVIKDSKDISFGLSAIKGVGYKVSEMIVFNRSQHGQYKDLQDFVKRLGPEVINKKTMESLTKAGALDNFGQRAQILFGVDNILKYSKYVHKQSSSGQMGLFDNHTKIDTDFDKINLPDVEPIEKKQLLAWEKEYLGIYLSEHPLNEYKHIIKNNAQSISSIQEKNKGSVIIGGIISKLKKIITKRRKEEMAFVTIEDFTSSIEVLVFPKIFSQNHDIWKEGGIVIVKGTLSTKDDSVKLLVEKVKDLVNEQGLLKKQNNIYIELSKHASRQTLIEIKKIISLKKGFKDVMIKIPSSNGFRQVKTKIKSNIDDIREDVLKVKQVEDIY
jgi:DNA polymerase-3 subunit alpha